MVGRTFCILTQRAGALHTSEGGEGGEGVGGQSAGLQWRLHPHARSA